MTAAGSGPRLGLGGVGIWTNQLDAVPAAEAIAVATRLEGLGYSALWAGELSGREALTQAGLLLAGTSRMAVGTGVASVYGRDPVTMAQAQRTLLEAYGERFVLGLGISHPMVVEQMRGLKFTSRVPTMRAYLEAMDAAPFGPPGAPRRGPRVIGAVGPRMTELAARSSSGVLPLGMPVRHTAQVREQYGPGPFIGVVVPVDLGGGNADQRALSYVAESLPNRAHLLRALGYSTDLAGPGGRRLVEAIVAHGGVDEVARRIREHQEAGADHVALSMISPPGSGLPVQQWAEAAAVLPAAVV